MRCSTWAANASCSSVASARSARRDSTASCWVRARSSASDAAARWISRSSWTERNRSTRSTFSFARMLSSVRMWTVSFTSSDPSVVNESELPTLTYASTADSRISTRSASSSSCLAAWASSAATRSSLAWVTARSASSTRSFCRADLGVERVERGGHLGVGRLERVDLGRLLGTLRAHLAATLLELLDAVVVVGRRSAGDGRTGRREEQAHDGDGDRGDPP